MTVAAKWSSDTPFQLNHFRCGLEMTSNFNKSSEAEGCIRNTKSLQRAGNLLKVNKQTCQEVLAFMNANYTLHIGTHAEFGRVLRTIESLSSFTAARLSTVQFHYEFIVFKQGDTFKNNSNSREYQNQRRNALGWKFKTLSEHFTEGLVIHLWVHCMVLFADRTINSDDDILATVIEAIDTVKYLTQQFSEFDFVIHQGLSGCNSHERLPEREFFDRFFQCLHYEYGR